MAGPVHTARLRDGTTLKDSIAQLNREYGKSFESFLLSMEDAVGVVVHKYYPDEPLGHIVKGEEVDDNISSAIREAELLFYLGDNTLARIKDATSELDPPIDYVELEYSDNNP